MCFLFHIRFNEKLSHCSLAVCNCLKNSFRFCVFPNNCWDICIHWKWEFIYRKLYLWNSHALFELLIKFSPTDRAVCRIVGYQIFSLVQAASFPHILFFFIRNILRIGVWFPYQTMRFSFAANIVRLEHPLRT